MNKNVYALENSSTSPMDFSYMDELLLDGCWLQTTNGSQILNNNPSACSPPFGPSFQWPKLEPNVEQAVSSDEERDSSKSQVKSLISSPNKSEFFFESSKQWWIAPMASSGSSLSVMERLMYAIDGIKRYAIDKHALIQVWLPETRDGNKVLSTSRRLFSLDLNCPQLSNYRNVSESYHFPAEGDAKDNVGLPGRVFMEKVPEWTPDVRLFKIEEYSRVSHAQAHDVRGSFAVPVFDHDVKNCVGVVEVVMTTQKSKYTLEIQSLCNALEAVDLRSSEVSNTQKIKVSDGFYHPALIEILEALKCACMMHNLPLAQTWIPCINQGGKSGCRHSSENLVRCISTVDSASYVSDQRFKDFQEACSEHHLFIGQGVVGKAFTTNEAFCYSPDVTAYLKAEYPLAHHAKIFDLHAAVAIRVRTKYAPAVDFVLEFFLPVDCKTPEEQKVMINSLLVIIRKVCGGLRIAAEMELPEDGVQEDLLAVSDKKAVPKVQETNGHSHGPWSGLGSGSSSGSGSEIEKRRAGAKLEKTITLEMIRQQFAGSLKEAAKNIGVCPTTLKRICRQHGIQRWPSRKIKKVDHSLKKIQLVMESIHGGSGSFQLRSLYSNFPKVASPNPSTTTHSPFQATNIETFDSKPTDSTIVTTSCSLSSSSGNSLSGDTPIVPIFNEVTKDGALKRTKSDADIHASNNPNKDPKIFLRSKSHKSLHEPVTTKQKSITDGILLPTKCENHPPKPRERHLWRVKVTFGNEKLRFRMQKVWGYSDLLQEIAKRFCLNDTNRYQLKYLDEDNEWVLLTCDADVEECLDVYKSFKKSGTIRLTLREQQLRVGSSLGPNWTKTDFFSYGTL